MKKLSIKKIHFGYALFIIIALSVIPISLFMGLMLMPSPADAFIGFDIGIWVVQPPIPCVQDTLSPTCLASCPVCGNLAGLCNNLAEIKSVYLSGQNILYLGQALCISKNNIMPPNGGAFVPGAQCFGKVLLPAPPHILFNFGCGL